MSQLEYTRKNTMNLNAPKKISWFVSCALLVAALVVKFAVGAADAGFWLAYGSGVLMLLATYFVNM